MNKKNLINSLFMAIIFLLFTINFSYGGNVQFQNVRVGGTGCPANITQIVLAPDLSTLSLLFQSFESKVPVPVNGPKTNPYISILNCNVFLDVNLPTGEKLDAFEISYDMRGHTTLDRGVNGEFKSYLISSNGLGTERTQQVQLIQEKIWANIFNHQEEDFYIRSIKSFPLNSQCNNGSNNNRVSIHLQHQLKSQITSGYERTNAQGSITMDSSDLQGGIKFRAYTSSCNSNNFPPSGRQSNCRLVRINGRIQTICQ